MIQNIIKRYYQNVCLLDAYTPVDFMKQLFLFPVDYYFRGGRSSFPLNITLALTLRCNAKCSMCALGGVLNAKEEELSLQDYKDIIDSSARRKPGFVLYGGEPFLRKDIFEIIAAIKKHNLSCGIFTNGTLLNQQMLEEIIRLNVNFIVFSLYGPAKVHDKIVGIDGAYDKIILNAEFLKKNRKKTKVVIHCTVSQDNIDHLGEMTAIPCADAVRFGHLIFATGQEKEKFTSDLEKVFPQERVTVNTLIFDPDKTMAERLISRLKEQRLNRGVIFTPELTLDEIPDWYSGNFRSKRKCFFVWRGVFIGPNGDVYPCMGNFSYKMGNIKQQSLESIWNGVKYIRLRNILKRELLPACARCCRL